VDDGVCGFVFDLARRLALDHGHEVRVVAPLTSRTSDDAAFAPVTVERVGYPWPRARRFRADVDLGDLARAGAWAEGASFVSAFTAHVARAARHADAICSQWLVPAGFAGALARRAHRPHVAIAHGGDVHLLERMPGGKRVAREIASRTDRLVFVSDDLAMRFGRLAPAARARSEIVPMGAEIGTPAPASEVADLRASLREDQFVAVLFLGRLVSIKGVDVLLDAAARVPGIALWVAGDGPESRDLRARAEAARLPVSFFGRVDRKRRRALLDACDVVAIPSRIASDSRGEGMPVVCAEAFAAGRPVVATRTGGLAHAIGGDRTGLLVEPDDPAALAAALARFVADRGLAVRLGEAAAREGFSAERTTAEIDRILQSVAARRKLHSG